jgi:hypothetical protein
MTLRAFDRFLDLPANTASVLLVIRSQSHRERSHALATIGLWVAPPFTSHALDAAMSLFQFNTQNWFTSPRGCGNR